MCRQFIREFCRDEMPIYMYDKDGQFVVRTLGELLPMSFGPGDLDRSAGQGKTGEEEWMVDEQGLLQGVRR
jgi:hypothetical protein